MEVGVALGPWLRCSRRSRSRMMCRNRELRGACGSIDSSAGGPACTPVEAAASLMLLRYTCILRWTFAPLPEEYCRLDDSNDATVRRWYAAKALP